MNLLLSFIHFRKPPRSVGPFRAVRFDGETLRDAWTGAPIALHRDHQWEVEGERFSRLDTTSRVRIHFEHARQMERSRDFGPYERFSAIDGIAYADERVFAFVDRKVGDWFCYDDGRHWPVMIVSEAPFGKGGLLASLAALAPLLPGVIALWRHAELVWLGRTASLRAHLAALCAADITAVSWEAHADPAAREAELLAEIRHASSSLLATYGRLHGSWVRTCGLVAQAVEAKQRAHALRREARRIRAAA